jgi:flagellar export protein FliJ
MKKFKFTLQTVHNVREMKQEKEEFILGELQMEAAKAAQFVSEVEQMRFKAIDNYASRLQSGAALDAFELELNSNHIAALDRLRREAQNALEIKKQACLQQSKTVAAAMREVKITDRLRENQQSRHRLEFDRYEQNALDELVSANFARRMSQAK